MAGIDDLITLLRLLPIDHLDNDWVNSAWEKDFVELNELPIELQDELDNNNYCARELKDLQPKLTFWVNYEPEDETEVSFWTILVENDISYRHLIAFLASLIETASKAKVVMAKRHAGLLAACSYFQLASMSGSGAFKVFNPMLLNQCLDALRKWTFTTNTGSRKRKLSKGPTKGGRQKCRKVNKGVEVDMGDDEDEDSDDSCDGDELSPSEINTLHKVLIVALKTFVKFLQKFSLRASESSISKSIQVMCELTRPFSGNNNNNNNINSRMFTFDVEKATSPVELAFVALKEICSSFQGNISERINIVSKQLMGSILMLGANNKVLSGQNIPAAYSQTRVNAINFVCHLIEEHGEVIIQGIRTLIQHLCVKVPDKTEHRAKVSESIVKMMASFDDVSFAKMVKWIASLTNTSKVGNRVIGIEILYLLLFKPEKQPSEDFPEDLQIYLTHKKLLTYIISRCSDSASSVRSRAIAIFSNCVASDNQIIVKACQELFTPQFVNAGEHPPRLIPTPVHGKENQATTPKDNENADLSPMQQVNKTPTSANRPVITGATPFVNLNFTPVNNNLPDNLGVLSMLKRRTSDDKVFVRKSALQAFESLVRMQDDNSQAMAVDILEERCRDPSLTVRKQAMQSLSSLLVDLPTNHLIQNAWLNGVLPLILDRESSLQEKCMKCLEEIILHNICPYRSSPTSQKQLMWNLLHIMSGEAKDNLRRYLQQAIGQWGRAKLIKASHINALKTHVETENSVAAWMLLAELSSSFPKFNAEFVVDYWKENCAVADPNVPIMTHRSVLAVILNAAKMISTDDQQEIVADLKERLLQFRLHVDIIPLTVKTMKTLADNENCKKSLQTIFQDLFQASDKFLSKVILNETQNPIAEDDVVICHLFTLGEVAQLFPSYVTHRILLLVQSIIASPCITECVSKSSQTSSTTESQESAGQNSSSQGLETASSQQKLSQGSSQGSEPLSQFSGSKWCSRVRGHAFITLGKLCLQNEKLAKKCIAALVRELETSSEEAIRNNVVFILCDLCIRYATLVDRYISRIAACLNASSPLIRKQTLTLLTMLIQEDYLKWKGVLFYRFITTLLDEQEEIRIFSEYCLINCLLVRNPNIMFYHFIECIFYFNNYQKHPMYNRFSQDQEDKNLVSLLGKSKSHLRQQLYAFMLQNMTDEQRFNLSAKLNQEILAGVVDGIIPLDTEGVTVLQDTLVILGCKEIKLSLIFNKTPDENMDEEDMAAAVIATAKKNLITQVMKKNVIENIVPIVTSLKHLLETKRSPVLKELMLYLRELMKDFKNEIKEILISDKQLADEIEFDLRKFEDQQKLEQQQQQQSPALPELNGGRRMSISCAIVPTASPPPTTEPTDQSNKHVKQLVPGIEGMSLSKQAILNSTRKSLKKIQNTPRRSSLSSNASTNSTGGNHANSDGSSRQMSKENTSPMDRGISRAISTPFLNKSKNITFTTDPNISAVPPSPIRQNNVSISDLFNSTSNASTSLNEIEKDKPDIIHLNSPDNASAAPKIWKITPNKSLRKTSDTEELIPEDPNVSVGVGKIRAVRLNYK